MTRRTMLITALMLSLSLNLFFIGGISYRLATFREFGPRPMPPNVDWVVRDLPEQRQAELEPLLQRDRESGRSARFSMFRAQRQIAQLMTADEFDSEALSEALRELRQLGMDYQELSHEQTVALLSALTQEERQTALEFMQRRGPRLGGPPSGGDFRRDRDGDRNRDRDERRFPDRERGDQPPPPPPPEPF